MPPGLNLASAIWLAFDNQLARPVLLEMGRFRDEIVAKTSHLETGFVLDIRSKLPKLTSHERNPVQLVRH
jgi:hypothetical protein